jgi:CheY-like chemotaxis protein
LVELHGGSIRAESAGTGQGSRFVWSLLAAPAPPVQPAPAAPVAAPRVRAARIAIVDDNQDAAESLAELLRFEGHEVAIAHNGEDALRLLQDQPAHVALLDIGLPDMDGYELAARLRADARTRTIRLVALTGYGRERDRDQAIDAGFERHLTKPVELDTLLDALASLLNGAPVAAT